MAETLALTIAKWSAATEWSHVPAAQRRLVELRMLDTLGLILAAADSPQAAALMKIPATADGNSSTTLIGCKRRVQCEWSALIHATLAHSLDFDDTFPDSVVHPGSVVVPTALAVGEAADVSGEDLLVAIAIGYEVAARLAGAAGRRLHARGFHASGIVGPLASAATAAKLLELDSLHTARSLGIAASLSGGLLEFVADGSWTKWLHLGWAAHSGIVAARMAEAGFSGPVSVLEGRHGFYRAFLGDPPPRLETIVEGLGQDWRGAAARFKLYPCAHVIQPYIDAALALRKAHELAPRDIVEVRCSVAPWCVPLVCAPRGPRLRPENELQALGSLPFLVAAALVKGEVTLDTIAATGRSDTQTLQIAERVAHVEDPGLGSGFDGVLEIEATGGRRVAIRASLGATDPARIRDKFRRNASRPRSAAFIDRVEALVAIDGFDLTALLAALAQPRNGSSR